MDNCDELIPKWLNVESGGSSFEHLLQKNLAKKCLEMTVEIAEDTDDHKKFYEQFGKSLQLGFDEDSTCGSSIAQLLRFNTWKRGDEQISLEKYVDRIKEGHNDFTTSSVRASSWCLLQRSWKICARRILKSCTWSTPSMSVSVQQLKEFDRKKLKSTKKKGLDFGEEDEKAKLEEPKAEFEPLTKLMKESVWRQGREGDLRAAESSMHLAV